LSNPLDSPIYRLIIHSKNNI